MKFYRRDPDRALSGMAELTLQERGAYNTILDALYSRDGVLPDDNEMLRRMMGCHGNELRAVKRKLIERGKIWIEDGYIKAKGVDDTISEAAEFSEVQRKRVGIRWENERKRSGKDRETGDKQPGNTSHFSEKCNKNNDPPIPYTTTETVNIKGELNGVFAAARRKGKTDFSQLENRQAYARQKIQQDLLARMSPTEVAALMLISEDPEHQCHGKAVNAFKGAAERAGVKWLSPCER